MVESSLKRDKISAGFFAADCVNNQGTRCAIGLHPGVMLLPSIFWTDAADRLLVGALLAAVMASKSECRMSGIASSM